MTHLDLFAGIGGTCLAAEWAGMETVALCEIADYPRSVLARHWPNAHCWGDIRTLTGDDFYAKTGLRSIDVLTASPPCQPFSLAGRQQGKEDTRYLWPECLRVVRETKPRWVVIENVPGILNIAADTICSDLEREGYSVGIFDFEAAAVGAPHRRERIVFVGYSDCDGLEKQGHIAAREMLIARCEVVPDLSGDGRDTRRAESERFKREAGVMCGSASASGVMGDSERGGLCGIDGRRSGAELADGCEDVPNMPSDGAGETLRTTESGLGESSHGLPGWMADPINPWAAYDWDSIPRVGTMIPHRVERIKALGNAVVPQWAYPVFRAIMDADGDD